MISRCSFLVDIPPSTNVLARYSMSSGFVGRSPANPKLPPATTAEEAIGDLPPIYARDQLASGELRRGAPRFDQALLYDRRRKVSVYAQAMREWPGFEAPPGLKERRALRPSADLIPSLDTSERASGHLA